MHPDQLPIFQVTLPLIAAPLAFLLNQRIVAWVIALIASLCAAVISMLLLQQVTISGEIITEIGGWPAPWGIEYRVDMVNAFVLLIVSSLSTVTLLFARASVAREIPEDKQCLFYTTWLLCLTGLLGVTITGDAFNVFVFLEISSLSSYVLIAMGRDRRALTASFQYLVMGTIGATFILIGIGFLYISTGTLNMADMAVRLEAMESSRTIESAFAFIVVGIGLKLAMFPLHLWLPNAYAFAPSAVSAFLAATATKVALYMLLRFVYTIFGIDFAFASMPLTEILLILAVPAVLIPSTVAIFQDNVKRMLAYSSVAQIGYMLLGMAMATQAGLTASILHLFNHALMKGGLFLALGCVVYRIGGANLNQLAGLSKRMPWTFAALIGGGLSLIGVPLTAGFASKWLLVSAALSDGWWPLAVVVLVGSLLSIIYIWRLVEAAYFRADDGEVERQEAPLGLLIPTWILIAANIYFGIYTELSIGVSKQAAAWLMGAG